MERNQRVVAIYLHIFLFVIGFSVFAVKTWKAVLRLEIGVLSYWITVTIWAAYLFQFAVRWKKYLEKQILEAMIRSKS